MIIAALAAAALQPQVVARVPARHRLVEGVASDGRTIWVSSLLDRVILACAPQCRPLTTLPAGLYPLGMAWDARSKRLWIAADCPKLPDVTPCETGALVALDRRGRLRSRIVPAGGFHPGDVSVGGGRLFVSDSSTGAVCALTGKSLTPIVARGTGKSAQGSVLDRSGTRLTVADYSHGFAEIDLATNARALLPRQDGKPLRGVDGLARCGNVIFGLYNGAAPGRLLRITRTVTGIHYDEAIEGLVLPDPTQIAFDGTRLLIVADAGWEAAAKPAALRAEPAPIVAIPLSKDCTPI